MKAAYNCHVLVILAIFTFQRKKRHVIGYFDSEQNVDFTNYKKVASILRDDCQFYAAVG